MRFVACALALGLVACGTKSGAGPGDGDASADAGPVDAAPPVDAEQDPNVYPAAHHLPPLARSRGGAVLFTTQLVTVTFKNDPWVSDVTAFDDAIVGSDYFHATVGEYGIDNGTSLGDFEVPDTVSGKALDDLADLQPLLQQLITAGTIPEPSRYTLYAIFLPAGTTVTDRNGLVTCRDIDGYHDSMLVTLRNKTTTQETPYVVVPRCNQDKNLMTIAASHEIVEAVTDPHPQKDGAYYVFGNDAWTGPGGGEVCDLCEGGCNSALNVSCASSLGYKLARGWSNAAIKAGQSPCQPAPPGDVYFQTAVETQVAAVTNAFGSYSSDGYVIVKRGASTSVRATVFSAGPLPNELSLYVGSRVTSNDPTVVGPIANGKVTAALSRPTAHNGNSVALTLTAASDAPTGDFPFDVRTVLSPTSAHSWPVVLRITP